ncbi:hypothetical protein [Polynucleobacter necessarius]|uniref:hypothetical protein n=1 Tax=Polynucleobacter necessarius TaxID=576610 RepID=UPI000E09C689|nr:hypothetical protein [Polynucleobacter necessarius]HAT38710.1 hypothetical protein [Polynucleobacter sp.]
MGVYNRPIPGEHVSGDAILVIDFKGSLLLEIADVSGHGPKSHEVSAMISKYIADNVCRDLSVLMTGLHKVLVGTLGAAAGLLLLDIASQTFQSLGIGNTGANRCVGEFWNFDDVDRRYFRSCGQSICSIPCL